MNELLANLTENCCARAAVCAPACNPASNVTKVAPAIALFPFQSGAALATVVGVLVEVLGRADRAADTRLVPEPRSGDG